MTPPAPLAIALDHSGPELAVACADAAGTLLCHDVLPGGGRDAAAMLPRLVELLGSHGCELRTIHDWTVGTGPGGFTGLRALAAFVAGLTSGRNDVRVRGIPSALALAATASPDGLATAVLYPQRNGGVIVCHARHDGENWRLDGDPVTVADPAELHRRLPRTRWTALTSHRPALAGWADDGNAEVVFQESIPVQQLLRLNPGDWRHATLFDIVYLHPAAVATTANPVLD
jgi:tRNA threonylcarbamoyl adenosine modification protein YeaZ